MKLFRHDGDYAAFQKVMVDAQKKVAVPLLGYCLMPNHWHLVLEPRSDGDLSKFMHWLTMTHTQRWRHQRRLVGLGPLYQGRFRAFAIEADEHLLTVLRYVERNPLRAGLVSSAEAWRYHSLYDRAHTDSPIAALAHPWPIDIPNDYLTFVNQPQTAAEEEALRVSIQRNRPFGGDRWRQRMVRRLGLESTLRPCHRPANQAGGKA